MFNLEHAISGWRRRAQREGLPPGVIEELETHLRDEIEQQMNAGADAQVAFATAAQLLGDTAELRQEFTKTNPLVGVDGSRGQRWARNISLFGAFAIVAINTWTLLEFELSAFERVVGAYAVAVTALFVVCAPFLQTWLPRAAFAGLAWVIKVSATIAALIPVFLLLSLMKVIPFESGPFVTLLIWLFLAGVFFSVLAIDFGSNPNLGGLGGGSGGQMNQDLPPQPPGPVASAKGALPIRLSNRLAADSRELLELAKEEAARFGHDFVGTEHVLIGFLRVGKGAVTALLSSSKVCIESVREETERLVGTQKPGPASAAIPLTPRARKAFQIAGTEASRLQQPLVTPDHVLLGLILEGSGVGAIILKKIGIRADQVRERIATLG